MAHHARSSGMSGWCVAPTPAPATILDGSEPSTQCQSCPDARRSHRLGHAASPSSPRRSDVAPCTAVARMPVGCVCRSRTASRTSRSRARSRCGNPRPYCGIASPHRWIAGDHVNADTVAQDHPQHLQGLFAASGVSALAPMISLMCRGRVPSAACRRARRNFSMMFRRVTCVLGFRLRKSGER